MSRPLCVFLCHAREDKTVVRELYRQLTAEGWMDVWLDEMKLLPGQEWDIEIEKAVEQANVVIVCLSNKSVDKEGYVQKELRFVLNIADEKPEGTIFVIPLRLDDCVVPRRIRAWQYVDYFPKNNQRWAYQRLVESLKLRAAKLGVSIEKPVPTPIENEQAKDERERIAAQKAEAERVAREKAEREREAKAKRDRIARQKAEEQRIAWIEALRKINFKPVLAIGGVIVVLLCLVFGVNYLIKNFPASPTPSETEVTSIPTRMQIPSTNTPKPPTFTPTPGIGSTITSNKGNMTMVFVPAGEFTMGSENGASDEKPVHQVYLDAFWIDQTEVTNAMFAKFIDDTGYETDAEKKGKSYVYQGGSWIEVNGANWLHPSGPNSDISGRERHPAIHVSWNDAVEYCEWRDDRLPTEAEWEKAARGTDERTYPWGNEFDGTKLNFCDKNCTLGKVDKNIDDGYIDTAPVGSYENGKSPYSLYDMAGNIWEWVSNWYDVYLYPGGDKNASSNFGKTHRVLRGGSWGNSENNVRSANRGWFTPTFTSNFIGFRCVRSAE
jgi:formylglycine-generating enzyme required for sulfatase activity